MNVAVVIPALNEEAYIEACVRSVVDNDYQAGQITVFVSDGRSTDKTREIIETMSQQHPNVHLIDNPARITPIALNLGLKASKADVKIILGAHSVVAQDFIRQNVQTLIDFPEAGCVGGVIENVFETEEAAAIGKAMSSPFGVGNATFRTGGKNGFVDTVAFGAYRNEVFEKIGYFDEDLVRNQDDEFNHRLLSNGFKIYLNNAIQCQYFVRASFAKLWKQYFQYGYWKVFVNRKVKTVTTMRQLFPAALIVGMVFGGLLSLFIPYLVFAWLLGMIAYIVGAIYFAIQKSEGNDLWAIIKTFFILHFSYGLGYLKGIWDFLILNKKPSRKSAELSR